MFRSFTENISFELFQTQLLAPSTSLYSQPLLKTYAKSLRREAFPKS